MIGSSGVVDLDSAGRGSALPVIATMAGSDPAVVGRGGGGFPGVSARRNAGSCTSGAVGSNPGALLAVSAAAAESILETTGFDSC